METYSLNQQPAPRAPLTKEEHHRAMTVALIAAAAALVIGLLYWWAIASRPAETVPAVDQEAKLRAQILSILNSTPEHTASPQEVDRITKQLSASPSTEASAEERAAILNRLNSTEE